MSDGSPTAWERWRNNVASEASPAQLVVWFLGLLLVLGAVYVGWSTTELRNLVPEGLVVALLILLLGIAVMAAAAQFSGSHVFSTERSVETSYPVRREREHQMPRERSRETYRERTRERDDDY